MRRRPLREKQEETEGEKGEGVWKVLLCAGCWSSDCQARGELGAWPGTTWFRCPQVAALPVGSVSAELPWVSKEPAELP